MVIQFAIVVVVKNKKRMNEMNEWMNPLHESA